MKIENLFQQVRNGVSSYLNRYMQEMSQNHFLGWIDIAFLEMLTVPCWSVSRNKVIKTFEDGKQYQYVHITLFP